MIRLMVESGGARETHKRDESSRVPRRHGDHREPQRPGEPDLLAPRVAEG